MCEALVRCQELLQCLEGFSLLSTPPPGNSFSQQTVKWVQQGREFWEKLTVVRQHSQVGLEGSHRGRLWGFLDSSDLVSKRM